MKIIITGGKSAKSLKLLKAFTKDEVILADYGEMPSLKTPMYSFLSIGERNDDTIAHDLLNVCLDQEADTLLPIHEAEVLAVAKASLLFKEYNINVLLPDISLFPKYFNAPIPYHKIDFVLFIDGKSIFSSQPWAPVYKDNMHGVFYFKEIKDEVFTCLYTIA